VKREKLMLISLVRTGFGGYSGRWNETALEMRFGTTATGPAKTVFFTEIIISNELLTQDSG
jgi:hypothetical protein